MFPLSVNSGRHSMHKCDYTMRHIIYYHQSLPLFSFKFSLWGPKAKENIFYYYLYPLYVKLFLNKHTFVAVQTEDIKVRFSKRYHFPAERIGVFSPEVEKIDVASVDAYEYPNDSYNFFYPSMGATYKEHLTLAYALERIYAEKEDVARRIRIHFTLTKDDNLALSKYIHDYQLDENFVFHGNMPHEQVLSMMKASHGLLFPSVIETLGLPLLEAASLGTPVIANDMGYAREVLQGYEGVRFVTVHDYDGWAAQMIQCCEKKDAFAPYHVPDHDSWKRLIEQIRGEEESAHDKKVICVLATASATRGALAIYKQFVHALEQYVGNDEWHVFVDVDMPMPTIPQVSYHVCHTKGFGRLWFDLIGFGREIKKMGVKPNVLFSLQNTGVICQRR